MTKTCCVPNCKRNSTKTSTNEKISYHCFPKNEELRIKWLLCISEENKPIKLHNFSQVCSKHFLESDYWSGVKSGKRLLKANSIPSQCIPENAKQNARKRKITLPQELDQSKIKTIACQTSSSPPISVIEEFKTLTPIELRASSDAITEENPIIPDVSEQPKLINPKIEIIDDISDTETRILLPSITCVVPNSEKTPEKNKKAKNIPIEAKIRTQLQREEIKSLKCKLIENEAETKRLAVELEDLRMKYDEERQENRDFVEKLQFISKNIKSSFKKLCKGAASSDFGKIENEEVLRVAVGQLNGTLKRWDKKLCENSLWNPLSSLQD